MNRWRETCQVRRDLIPCPRNDNGSRGSRVHEMRNRVRVMCKPGSVGGRGGQPPRSTRPGLRPFRVQASVKAPESWPGQPGLRAGGNLLGRNLDGNQIARKYRTCAGHADLLFRDGGKRQAGKCDCLLEFTSRPELSLRAAHESGHNSMCQNGLKVLLRVTVRTKKRDSSAISSGVAAGKLEQKGGTGQTRGPVIGRKRDDWRKRDGSETGPADVRAIFTRARHFDFGPPFAGDPWDDRPTLGPNIGDFLLPFRLAEGAASLHAAAKRFQFLASSV